MKTLAISVLGTPTFSLDGTFIEGFNSNKTRALLSYIALADAPCSRVMLAGLFWGELSEEKALTNLRKSILNLRKLIGDYLLINPQTVWLNFDRPIWVDAVNFEIKKKSVEEPHQLAEAVSLYRGDFLTGFYLKDATAFEEWADNRRNYYRESVSQSLSRLITHDQSAFDLETIGAFAQRLLELEPWLEEAHRCLMSVYSRIGQPQKAEKQYQACQAILRKELDVEVTSLTLQLHQRIQRAHQEFASNVPQSTTAFIGRKRELASLERLFGEGARLVTVLANGGMGKSRLSQAFGEMIIKEKGCARYWDGVFFVPLASVSEISHIVPAIASCLNFQLQNQSQIDPENQLIQFLEDKALLLILDNLEQLLDGSDYISKILSSCPDVDILVTSRERLKLYEEHVFTLWGLDDTSLEADLSEGRTLYAYELFSSTVKRLLPQFKPDETDQDLIISICQAVQGMPLAVELAASWADALSVKDIASELEAGLEILTTDTRNFPERHRSIFSVFSSSWKRLNGKEQDLLKALSIFRGSFNKEAIDGVIDSNRFHLAKLMSRALLYFEPSTQRYRIHELLRQFVYEKLSGNQEQLAATLSAHSRHYLSLVSQQKAVLLGVNSQYATQVISADIDNIRLAWHTAVDQKEFEFIDQTINSFSEFFSLQGWQQESIEMFGRVALLLANGDYDFSSRNDILGQLLSHQAYHQAKRGEYQEALTQIEKARVCLQTSSDLDRIAFYYLTHADIEAKLGRFALAKELADIGIEHAISGANDEAFIRGHNVLGIQAGMAGDLDLAIENFEKGLRVAEKLQYYRLISRTKINLGTVFCLKGKHSIGREYYRASLELMGHFNDQYLVANIFNNLGESAADTGDYDEAVTHLEDSLVIYHQLGAKLGIINALNGLGRVHLELADYGLAQEHFLQALKMGRKSQARPQLLQTVMWLGISLARQGDHVFASTILSHATQNAAAERLILTHSQPVLDHLKSALPAKDWEAAWEEGQRLSLEELAELLANYQFILQKG